MAGKGWIGDVLLQHCPLEGGFVAEFQRCHGFAQGGGVTGGFIYKGGMRALLVLACVRPIASVRRNRLLLHYMVCNTNTR